MMAAFLDGMVAEAGGVEADTPEGSAYIEMSLTLLGGLARILRSSERRFAQEKEWRLAAEERLAKYLCGPEE